MKKHPAIIRFLPVVIVFCVIILISISIVDGASVVDKRGMNLGYTIAKYSIDQVSWITGAGNAEQTETIEMFGMVEAIGIRISSVTDDPDITIKFTDSNGNEIYNTTALNDGTNYYYTPLEFLPTAEKFPVWGDITISVTPSADAGGSNQTLTVDIDIIIS